MKIQYIFGKKLNAKSMELVDLANNIIEDYQARGYDLTLRQLYYQLVARDFIPNSEKSYIKLSKTMSNARLYGLVDWNAIIDRTRERTGVQFWDNPNEILETAAGAYKIDLWQNQDYRVFVWVEKEALAGVVQTACNPWRVDFISCRGYMSQSTMWAEAVNLAAVCENEQTPVVIHLGDHDPSGLDMTRDNIDRIELFSKLNRQDYIFERIALNYDQVETYNPPPNPAKMTDTRADGYIGQYGRSSWELDALDPDILVELIQDTIQRYINFTTWNNDKQQEETQKQKLREVKL